MDRFFEPSTWAGLGVLFQTFKAFVPPSAHIWVDGATAVAGTLAGVMRERGGVPR
jgi:hypothetical protein